MKQLTAFIILVAVLFSCQQPEPTVIVKTITIYRDTCDSEFIRKIGQIESNNTDSVVEANGHGYGRYKIYNIFVKGS